MPADTTTLEAPVEDATWQVVDAETAVKMIVELERERRQVEVRQVNLLAALDVSCAPGEHGHASGKVMMRHNANLSGSEAAARQKVARLVNKCARIDAVFQACELGVDQIRLLGRVFSNRRIRAAFIDQQDWFIARAEELCFNDFADVVAAWLELADQDGADPHDRAHLNRDCTLTQNSLSKVWETKATQAPNAGAIDKEIFDAYVEAEFHKDWEHAKQIHGDDVCNDLLARTDAQRRADAHHQIYLDAAANKEVSAAANVVHNIMYDHDTYDEMASRFAGNPANPLDPDSYRCTTIDGHRLNPAEAFLDSLTSQIRRVIIDAKGVVLDMGHARFFTGYTRLAAQFNRRDCGWVGCHIPVSRCQIDHMNKHSHGGPTNPNNGVPMCRRHNRHKEKGYKVWRDNTGTIHILTPTGKQIH